MRLPFKPDSWTSILLGLLIFAPSAGVTQVPFEAESRVWFEGSSTVRDFTCRADAMTGQVATIPGGPRLAIGSLKNSFRGANVVIPVAGLDCRNGTMNDHMRRALKAETNPTIEFGLTGYEIVREGPDETIVRLSGGLTMAGQRRPITFEAIATPANDGDIRVVGSHALLMTEWGMRPPSLMLGAMKVRDPVTVRFDVLLKP